MTPKPMPKPDDLHAGMMFEREGMACMLSVIPTEMGDNRVFVLLSDPRRSHPIVCCFGLPDAFGCGGNPHQWRYDPTTVAFFFHKEGWKFIGLYKDIVLGRPHET